MDRSQNETLSESWVQVIGRVAIHASGREPIEPKGSTRTLLGVLVAAGRTGISVEDLARTYWRADRPDSWPSALRFATSHLQYHLPHGWVVNTDDDQIRLEPGAGWIDAWRVEDAAPLTTRPDWLRAGTPFAGITGVDIVDLAKMRLNRLLPARSGHHTRPPRLSSVRPRESPHNERLRRTRRAIVTGEPDQHNLAMDSLSNDAEVHTNLIIGDAGLRLPLGPFAMGFPELREQLALDERLFEPSSVSIAWRIVADALGLLAAFQPQRLVIANAHELDQPSLHLASWLIERGPLSDFSIVLCADKDCRDLRWIDFINRSVTAGCELIELGLETTSPPGMPSRGVFDVG